MWWLWITLGIIALVLSVWRACANAEDLGDRCCLCQKQKATILEDNDPFCADCFYSLYFNELVK